MSEANDRNLLLGVLVVRLGFTDRPALTAAMDQWAKEPDKPLDAVLVAAGAIDEGQRAVLAMAVEAQMHKHGTARQSIAAMQAGPLAEDLLRSRVEPGPHSHLSTLAVAQQQPAPDTAIEPAERSPADRGRFRIVRWLAGGGLGDVFLARDEELGREVALKEIRERYADNVDLRSRFTLEAEITGNLEHPGIVPVYGKGQDATGRPYYAMRFIRGESLSAAIARFHEQGGHGGDAGQQNLALRKLLSRFIDVCNAVAYAHSRGVIHRDLKPENIMLGPYGETLVVDWGLAKLVQKPEPPPVEPEAEPPRSTLHPMGEGSPTPTQIGAVVGTLAYMSPEQAAGLVDQLTPASDIYSLGGTLFALLCGKAPFEGLKSDELRHGIIMGKHATPRQIDARIPPALEAICLKAMSIDPARRYGSARELAEDVEAWLADQPVGAWREPFRVRARRWMRRHRMLVSSAMAGVLVAAVSLAVGVVLLSAANERERAAKVLAEENQQAAEKNFEMAREAVDEYLTRVSDDPRLKAHDLERLRRDLLETARDFYERFLEQRPDEPELQAAAGWSHFRLAAITAEIGSKQRAIELLRQAVGIFAGLAEQHPAEADYRTGLLKSRVELAEVYCTVSRPEDAAKVLELVPKHADALAAADREAADAQALVASALSSNAKVYLAQKKFKEADAAYKEAIAVREKLVRQYPDVADYQCRLGHDKTALGLLCRQQSRTDEAEKLFSENSDLCKALVEKYRDVPEYQRDLAAACENLATILLDKAGTKANVESAYKTALQFRERLLGWHPEMTEYRADAARAHFNLAWYYWRVGRLTDAATSFQTAQKYYDRLVAEHGEVPDYQDALGSTLNNLALLHALLNQHDPVRDLMQGAIAIRSKLTDEYPDNFLYRANLGSSQRNFGDWLMGRGRVEDSQGPYRDAAQTYEGLVARFPYDVAYAEQVGALYNRLGLVGLESDRLKDAEGWCLKAKRFWQVRPAALRDVPQGKTILRDAHWGCAEALSRLGQHDRAAAEWEQAYAYDLDTTHWLLRVPRTLALARAGDHARAAAEAKELLPLRKGFGLDLYRLATAWALCSRAAAADALLDEAKRQQLAEEYASAALDALGQCREAGFFADPRRTEQLQRDAAFDPLRERDEFKKAMGEKKTP